MDWRSLILIGLILASAASWLEIARIRKFLGISDLEASRKWKKTVAGPRRVPLTVKDDVPIHAKPAELRFYRDSAQIVTYLNSLYADEPWSFQGKGELLGPPGELATRKIEIWYNQTKTGWVEISSYRYGSEGSLISVNCDLINGRSFGGEEVMGIAITLAQLISRNSEYIASASSHVASEMIRALWRLGEGAVGNPDLNFRFSGCSPRLTIAESQS